MKTAIAIDSLLLRDDSVFLVELLLNLFPHSELYTVAHKRGGILGQIETRPIVSSFLTNRVQSPAGFGKNFWLVPSAVKAVPIHPSIEKVIVVSRGYVHGLSLPAHVEKLLYILEWDFIDQSSLGWQRLFKSYVNDWREKALVRFPKIAVSSNALKERLELPNAEVIEPTYRTEEYPFVRDEDHSFDFTHHLLFSHDVTAEEFRTIAAGLVEKKETLRVLGPDAHLAALKKDFPAVDFAGDHCEATSALYSHQAKVIWDLSRGFPARALGAFATGRPVITRDLKLKREFLTAATVFLPQIDAAAVEAARQEIEATHKAADRRALRRLGLKWNERLFKSRMARFLNKQE